MPLYSAKLQSKSRKFPIFQSLKFKVWILQPYWGPKAPSRAHRAPRSRKGHQPSAYLLVSLYWEWNSHINYVYLCYKRLLFSKYIPGQVNGVLFGVFIHLVFALSLVSWVWNFNESRCLSGQHRLLSETKPECGPWSPMHWFYIDFEANLE